MNKSELIERIANEAGIPKKEASKVLDATLKVISSALTHGDTVTIVGFGSFKVSATAERTGRNPRTGAAIKIKAAKKPSFRPGAVLKAAVFKGPTGGGGPGKKR